MTEPLKPRIDFTGPLETPAQEQFKHAQRFDALAAEKFAPVAVEELPEEGQAEAVVEAALRPKRTLWRKMITAGLALAGITVIGQGVQWAMNAWQTQDWVALGGCSAGTLIVGAGVGSIASEWRRLWRLRQRAHERLHGTEVMYWPELVDIGQHGPDPGRARGLPGRNSARHQAVGHAR